MQLKDLKAQRNEALSFIDEYIGKINAISPANFTRSILAYTRETGKIIAEAKDKLENNSDMAKLIQGFYDARKPEYAPFDVP